jgi:hypothetical protein
MRFPQPGGDWREYLAGGGEAEVVQEACHLVFEDTLNGWPAFLLSCPQLVKFALQVHLVLGQVALANARGCIRDCR